MPTDDQSQPKRRMIHEPFHRELRPLAFGKFRNNRLQIAILARRDPLPVFAKGVEHTGIQPGFAPHEKEAAMAVYVSQIGSIKITPVGQEHIAPQTFRLGQVGMFGIGIRTQHDRDGGILE
jgi:hypothetical protein